MEATDHQPVSTGKCAYCGATLRSDQRYCTSCGAENPNFVSKNTRRIFHPKTIGELKEYCAERGMPLLRMRFFIGEDYKEPRAFGIYQDGNRFVVYKNKDTGDRAIRYNGPDEAYAVNEIFQKLLSECHNRGIYPDREPGSAQPGTVTGTRSQGQMSAKGQAKKGCLVLALIIGLFSVLGILIIGAAAGCMAIRDHKDDGYYRVDQSVYYQNGSSIYYLNEADDWWVSASYPYSGTKEFLGKEYSDDFEFSQFDRSRVGYPNAGYYHLQDGTWYYAYASDWFVYNAEVGAWQEYCKAPHCPAGFKQDDAYLGWDHDASWNVPDTDSDFYIATLKDWHCRDGYYRFGDDLYYYFGYSYNREENWYACGENGWQNTEPPAGGYEAYDQAFLSSEYDPAWGVPKAEDSFAIATKTDMHGRDGYYRFGGDLYYYYGKHYDTSDNWYIYDTGTDNWSQTDAPTGSYDEAYEGEDWNSNWGTESFTDSDTWKDLQPSNSSSSGSSYDGGYDSSYDSWDSSDTDWGSDW